MVSFSDKSNLLTIVAVILTNMYMMNQVKNIMEENVIF